jgi:uncharacterized membrane protein
MLSPRSTLQTASLLAALAIGSSVGVASASASTRSAKAEKHHVESHGRSHAKSHAKAHAKAAVKVDVKKDQKKIVAAAGKKSPIEPKLPAAPQAPATAAVPTTSAVLTTPTVPTTPTTPTVPTVPTTVPTTTTSSSGIDEPAGSIGDWTLAFDDEFNGTSLNTNVWTTHDGWTGQNNVTAYASNVAESGGNAILTLASSTSGAEIGTNDFGLKVGQFAEARIDFAGNGTNVDNWPAWWTSGPNWPAAGENDVAEGLGSLTVNYHSPSGAHNMGTVPGTWTGGFHTYGIYRGANYSSVYWDGQLVKTYPTDDNGQPQELLFTMGANNTMVFGAQGEMLIDYVRVYSPAS